MEATKNACPECANGGCAVVADATKSMRRLLRRRKKRDVRQGELKRLFARLSRDGHRRNVECYTLLMSALVSQGKPRQAQLLLRKMQEEEGLSPDSVCYNTLMNGWCEAGKMEEALLVLQAMKAAGCKPTTSTYNTLMKGYGLVAGQPEQAMRLLEVMTAPNHRTYNTLVHAWCKQQCMDEALGVMDVMCRAGLQPDVVTYNILATAYAEAGNAEAIERLMDEDMRNARIKPNVCTYAILVRCYCQLGMPERGLDVLRRLRFEGLRPDVIPFNILLKAAGELSDRVLQLMEESGVRPDVVSFSTIMDHWSSAGLVEEAESTLERMQVAGVRPDVVTFAILAKAYVRSGKPSKGEAILEDMALHGLTPNVVFYTTLMSGWCSLGKMEQALRIMDTMLARGISPNLQTFQTLIWGFGEARQPHKAQEMLQLMSNYGLVPDTKCFHLVADAWAALGLPGEVHNYNSGAPTLLRATPSTKLVVSASFTKRRCVFSRPAVFVITSQKMPVNMMSPCW